MDLPGYEMEEQLHETSRILIRRAKHRERVVVVKQLKDKEPRELNRFFNQAQANATVSHRNVLQIYDIAEHQGFHAQILEYCPGGSLAQKLTAGPLEPKQVVELMAKVAEGAEAIHQAGIVHRNFSPSAILFAADGSPRITDFGFARLTENDTLFDETQAPPPASRILPTADIFSLGAVLYTMLTGTPPFHAPSKEATLQRIMNDEPVPPSRVRAGIPESLDAICLKCLQKSPERRYSSARELADALKAASRTA